MSPALSAIELTLRAIEVLLVPLLFWIGKTLSEIRNTMNEINERLASLETWRDTHDTRDDERFREHGRRLEGLEGWGRGRRPTP